MDAVKYLEERKRMCGSYNNMCVGCGFGQVPKCNNTEDYNPEKAVAIVEKWSEEHPVKTRQSELLKLFPDTEDRNGVIPICPKHLIKGYECPENGDAKCIKCQEKFWLAEVE